MFAVSRSGPDWQDDVFELCGGEHRTSVIAIRRHMKVCPKQWDLSAGCDLNDPSEIAALWQYLQNHRPLVAVLQPPCTPFGPWANFNAVTNAEAYQRSYRICAPIARLAGDIALFQLSVGNHYWIEQPYPSGLFYEKPWPLIQTHPSNLTRVFDRCMTGQVTVYGDLVRKRTQVWVSDIELANPFEDLMCDGNHEHAHVEGSHTKATQTYTYDLASRIVLGIQRLLAKIARTLRQQDKHQGAYPAATFSLPNCTFADFENFAETAFPASSSSVPPPADPAASFAGCSRRWVGRRRD